MNFSTIFRAGNSSASEGYFEDGKYEDYASISLHFVNRFDDFNDRAAAYFPPSPQKEGRELIEQSLERILVTSDSNTFLKAARSQFDYVYAIDGLLLHMDNCNEGAADAHIKAFLEMMMVIRARKIYDLTHKNMYPGRFEHTASRINNLPY